MPQSSPPSRSRPAPRSAPHHRPAAGTSDARLPNSRENSIGSQLAHLGLHEFSGLIPSASSGDRFCPGAPCDGGEALGRVHQPVPSVAARLHDGLVAVPDAVAQEVGAQVGPDLLDCVSMLPLYAGFLLRPGVGGSVLIRSNSPALIR